MMIAGSGDLDFQAQAQASTTQVAALLDVLIQSQAAGIDWAAARKITLATEGGASIVIEGGNVTFECPGTITVHAGTKSFTSPNRLNQDMPGFPTTTLLVPLTLRFDHAPAGARSHWAGMPFKLYADGALVKQDVLDDQGAIFIMHSPVVQRYKLEMANGVQYDLPVADSYTKPDEGVAANNGYLRQERGPAAEDTGDAPAAKSLRQTYRKIFGH